MYIYIYIYRTCNQAFLIFGKNKDLRKLIMQLVGLLEINEHISELEGIPSQQLKITKKIVREDLQKKETGGSVIFGSSQNNVNFSLYFFKIGVSYIEKWDKEVAKRLINLPLEKKDIAQYLRNIVTVHGNDELCIDYIYIYIYIAAKKAIDHIETLVDQGKQKQEKKCLSIIQKIGELLEYIIIFTEKCKSNNIYIYIYRARI